MSISFPIKFDKIKAFNSCEEFARDCFEFGSSYTALQAIEKNKGNLNLVNESKSDSIHPELCCYQIYKFLKSGYTHKLWYISEFDSWDISQYKIVLGNKIDRLRDLKIVTNGDTLVDIKTQLLDHVKNLNDAFLENYINEREESYTHEIIFTGHVEKLSDILNMKNNNTRFVVIGPQTTLQKNFTKIVI